MTVASSTIAAPRTTPADWFRNPLPVNVAEMRADAEDDDFAFKGRLYFNYSFQRRCLPHPIPAPDELRRTIFACDWR